MVYTYYLEIKNRFLLLFLTWISTVFVCYIYKEILLFSCLTKVYLFSQSNAIFYFIFTDVKEVFSVYLQLVFFVGYQVFIFYLISHSLAFISLGLYKFEYRYLKQMFYSGFFFWVVSFMLLNQILLPISWNFFLSFQSLTSFNLYFEAKLNEYLNFYIFFYYICTFYCQISIILVFFFDYINTNLDLIRKFRKLFYYFSFFFSTLVTPPDVSSQILFSFAIIIIYEILIVFNIFKLFIKKRF
jgi:sec-independent protein translocase protein TatC